MDGTLYEDRALSARVALEAIRQVFPAGAIALARFRRRAEAARRAGVLPDPSWEAGIGKRLALEARLLVPAIRSIGPRPGVRALLDALRPRVASLVVVSDFDSGARLAALGLRARFDRIYAAERFGALKPDPRVFRRALDELGIAPTALLHIGDRPETDGRAARAAGCRALILGEDFDSFAELGGRIGRRMVISALRTSGRSAGS